MRATGSYGYGIYVNELGGHRRFQHNGYTPGYAAQLEYFPDDTLSIVVLANSPAKVAGLAESIARTVFGMPPARAPVRPLGWEVHPLRAGADTTTINFRPMGAGVHITSGEGAYYVHPDSVASGEYTLQATLFEYGNPEPDLGKGLVFGGRGLTAAGGRYLVFLIRSPGEYALVRYIGTRSELVVPWTRSAAVRFAGDGGNALTITVTASDVVLSVNGTVVGRVDRKAVGDTNGVVGLWIGPNDSVHIDGFSTVHGHPGMRGTRTHRLREGAGVESRSRVQ